MKRFTRLFTELDTTTRSSEKQASLVRYLKEAPPADAAWAVAILTGRRIRRVMPYKELRALAAAESKLPDWLVKECHSAVGDLSETIDLILPSPESANDSPELSLAEMFEQRIKPMPRMDPEQRNDMLRSTWAVLSAPERFVFHKMLSGNFKVGVQKRSVIRAVAEAFEIAPSLVEHRLSGRFEPTAKGFGALISATEQDEDAARPYPFYLASPIEVLLGAGASSTDEVPIETVEEHLGDINEWTAEWKWDGIRAQLIRRDRLDADSAHKAMLWSRGEEEIAGSFPEILAAASDLPDGTALDGELVAFENGAPLPFQELQRRLQRKQRDALLFQDVPVVFMAYDLLEYRGKDMRDRPFFERCTALKQLISDCDNHFLLLSETVNAGSWEELASLRGESRSRGVEGLMLKRKDSKYEAGRVRGAWWKWKVEPYTLDTVLVGAQLGHGRRATLFTDYTFAVWSSEDEADAELVPIAKAYSGLSNAEIKRVDKFIRDHTLAKHGPTRTVKPLMVFELAFEGIQQSPRHKSGIALRFPRIARIRSDKTAQDADTLDTARQLLRDHQNSNGSRR